MKRTITTLFLIAFISPLAFSWQGMPDAKVPQGENLKVPEGWEIRTDQPMDNLVVSDNPENGDIYFVNMTPGWHLTTGPRAIFWHPEHKAEGNYTISTSLYTFDPKGRDREGFGIFFGGSDLKEESQEYLYFLIRNTGDFLVKARKGAETEMIQTWTASNAIVRFTEDSESSELNELSVKVEGDIMSFHINGEEVASINTEGWKTDGMFGLRVNHAVNLHISDFSLNK